MKIAKVFFLFISLLIISCAPKEEPSSLANFNFERDIIIWDAKDIPVAMGVDVEYSDDDIADFNEMVVKWETAADTDFVKEYYLMEHKKFNKLEDYYFKDSSFGLHRAKIPVEGMDHTVIAACQILIEHMHNIQERRVFKILHGDIVLNDYYFDFNNGGGDGKFDKRTIYLHEFGHFIGLGDMHEGTMEGYMDTNEVSRELDVKVQDQIYDNYNFSNTRLPSNYVESDKVDKSLNERYVVTLFLKAKKYPCDVY